MCRRACPGSLATGLLTLALLASGHPLAMGADEVIATDGTRALVEAAARELAAVPTPPADESAGDEEAPAALALGGCEADSCAAAEAGTDSCTDACSDECASPCDPSDGCAESCVADACGADACDTRSACPSAGGCPCGGGDGAAGTCGAGWHGPRGCSACAGGRLGCGRCGGGGCLACCLRRGDYIDRWFNCGCDGSYKFPVPPLYTYHWPGLYSQQLMTDYHSPWRFPPLRPYSDEGPIPPEEQLTTASEPSAGVRPASFDAAAPRAAAAPRRHGRPSMSDKLERFYGERD